MLPALALCGPELIDAVLDGASEFTSGVLAPINSGGDLQGARLESGTVVTAPGWRAA